MTELLDYQMTEQDDIGLLFVDISTEIFAIPIHSVKEVIELTKITSVPMCSDVIHGVINVRGSVIPVIDAATRLGLPQEQKYDKYSCIVLYEHEQETVQDLVVLGLIVNRVRSIEMMAINMQTNKPAFGSHVPEQFVSKMMRIQDRVYPVLDMPVLLDSQVINQEILNHQQSLLRYKEQ
ncbi:chemotaxis protein CheW [Vibrio sp. ZSDE26]|uniref:Chemotaxis protein CheW n=1 Tax=Vibrio amylolyticus TaxID=2847292 RepID=A0A9X2BJM4_9VIBR|nr:chemotaxis protein CheW [Vibrio amylolyticus]MCK6261878.1 chemotaxis protein CheW [Vibrio amylolyticus]